MQIINQKLMKTNTKNNSNSYNTGVVSNFDRVLYTVATERALKNIWKNLKDAQINESQLTPEFIWNNGFDLKTVFTVDEISTIEKVETLFIYSNLLKLVTNMCSDITRDDAALDLSSGNVLLKDLLARTGEIIHRSEIDRHKAEIKFSDGVCRHVAMRYALNFFKDALIMASQDEKLRQVNLFEYGYPSFALEKESDKYPLISIIDPTRNNFELFDVELFKEVIEEVNAFKVQKPTANELKHAAILAKLNSDEDVVRLQKYLKDTRFSKILSENRHNLMVQDHLKYTTTQADSNLAPRFRIDVPLLDFNKLDLTRENLKNILIEMVNQDILTSVLYENYYQINKIQKIYSNFESEKEHVHSQNCNHSSHDDVDSFATVLESLSVGDCMDAVITGISEYKPDISYKLVQVDDSVTDILKNYHILGQRDTRLITIPEIKGAFIIFFNDSSELNKIIVNSAKSE